MPSAFFLDSSALGKHYVPEQGTAEMAHLFAKVPANRLTVITIGLLEVVSILVRRRNAGTISAGDFAAALSRLHIEMIYSAAVTRVQATDALALRAVPLIEPYSINGTDAMVLRSALDIAAGMRAAGLDLVLVTSDRRLLRAAKAEGLTTFDPETQSTTDLDALI